MTHPVEKWESMKTRSILRDFAFVAILVPLLALTIIASYVAFAGMPMEKRDWMTVVFVVWLGTLVCLGISLYRSLKDKIGQKD